MVTVHLPLLSHFHNTRLRYTFSFKTNFNLFSPKMFSQNIKCFLPLDKIVFPEVILCHYFQHLFFPLTFKNVTLLFPSLLIKEGKIHSSSLSRLFLRSRNYCAVARNRNYHMVVSYCVFGGGFSIPNLALVHRFKQHAFIVFVNFSLDVNTLLTGYSKGPRKSCCFVLKDLNYFLNLIKIGESIAHYRCKHKLV